MNVQLIAVELETLGAIGRAKTFLALVIALKLWAKAIKASRVFVHAATGFKPEATDRLMKAAGAKGIGGNYAL